MAKFLAGVGFGQASGSVAGSTYSHNKFGPYIRNRAMPVNPNTSFQAAVRSRFGNLSQSWRGLTASQRTQWNTQAVNISLVDSLGQAYTPTGAQYYVGVNANRIALGSAISTSPPAIDTQQVITSLSVTAVGATGVITATFAPAIAASTHYELLATAPMSAGKTFIRQSQFKTLAYLASTDTSPYVATTVYGVRFGAIVTGNVGQLIVFALRPYGANGYAGVQYSSRTIIT